MGRRTLHNIYNILAISLYDVLERKKLLPQRRKDANKIYFIISPFPFKTD
jgi:hypothetical protein